MPQHGDKLYTVDDAGNLVTVRFIRAEIAPGASVPTWIIDKGHKVQVSRDMYCLTPRAAYERFISELLSGIAGTERAIEEYKHTLENAQRVLSRARLSFQEIREAEQAMSVVDTLNHLSGDSDEKERAG
jgi:hypothetical protein